MFQKWFRRRTIEEPVRPAGGQWKDFWPLDRNQPFASVVFSSREDTELVLYLNTPFLDYITAQVTDEAERKQLLTDLAVQQCEWYEIQMDSAHPLNSDKAAFEDYCKKKYPMVYAHIRKMMISLA